MALENNIKSQEKKNQGPKRKFSKKKFLIAFLAIIFLVFIGAQGWREFKMWRGRREIDKFVELWEELEKAGYEQAMADTYGGTTPQETLQMYIEAVEAGDYELASKYFVIPWQERELNSLVNISENNPDALFEFIDFLKEAEPRAFDLEIEIENFTMEAPSDVGVPFRIHFTKYPNGIWKIQEI